MPSVRQCISSGSEGNPQYTMIDEKKRKRMISNRESARRSRIKKQKHLDDLLNQISQLQRENNEMVKRIDVTAQHHLKLASENNFYRAQVIEFTNTLQSLNSILRSVEKASGLAMDIPEIPDPLLKPWKLPCPSQQIMASTDLL